MRGPLFASPMGEPFHGEGGESRWFGGADTNGDGALSLAEMDADALRFFKTLDRAGDGEIDPDDLDYYETVLFPQIRVAEARGGQTNRVGGRGVGGGRRGGMGGRRGGGGERRDGGDQRGSRASAAVAGRQGAGRFSYLNIPEPVATADTNLARGVSRQEFLDAANERFALLDTNHDGRLTLQELPSTMRNPHRPQLER